MSIIKNSLSPSLSDLWFLPLGGTGEIGMNLNLYGHSHSWLMVDCGSTFNVPLDPAQDHLENVKRHGMVIPDAQFIIERKDDLQAIVLTHAHEDHIGALLHIWPQLQVPMYTTRFTAEVIRRKFYREELYYELPIVEVNPGDELDLGPFTVKWLPITHSIPETQALLITTEAGRVLHTADWKIDDEPVIGNKFKKSRYKALGSKNITAMVCDSTNAPKTDDVLSEQACLNGLTQVVKAQQGRVVVTCFASNIARLVSLAQVAIATDRYMAVFGRALENMISIARQCGYWPEEAQVIPSRHIGYLPKHEVLIVATGSQGEPRAALAKLARNNHRWCDLEAGDSVIFSSMVIPGNEAFVDKITQQLKEREIRVIQQEDTQHTIHVSGHANAENLAQMYRWVQPDCAIPTHGESYHMDINAHIAQQNGVPSQLTGRNGDIFIIAPSPRVERQMIVTDRKPIEQ